MKPLNTILLLLLLLASSCQPNQTNNHIPDFSDQIDYDYRATQFSGDDLLAYKYYDREGLLIQQVAHEYRTKYFYDESGKLIETYSCRMYNCEIAWRSILIYDDSGNHIGTYKTRDTLVNLDTVQFKQTKFYNDESQLIKELVDRGSDFQGNKYERWKHYTYQNDRIALEKETRNQDTIWTGLYEYDEDGNIIAINRKNEDTYENESFEYDDSGRLIKKSINSNEYPLTENTAYSVNNNSTTYKYDEQDRLIKETTFNHRGDKHREFTYVYEKNKNTNANKK